MGDYELLGTAPNKILKNRRKKIIIIIIMGILVGLTILISTKILSKKNNFHLKYMNSDNFYEDKEFSINDFELVNPNNTYGPITIDKSKDDGTKINLSDYIYDTNDNKLEYYLYDNETINALENRIDKPERYLCELEFRLSEDGGEGYDISCPLYYNIAIDKAFYGRYMLDKKHCNKDYKGEVFADSELVSLTNCGYGFEEKLKTDCEGKTNCSILPFRLEFANSCPGKKKYLHLKYHCAKNEIYKAPKFAVVMFANRIDPNSLYEHSVSEFYQYSKIHGYKFIFNSKRYDYGRDLFYMKLHVLIEAVIEGLKNKEYDWIFWADGDTAITNPNIKLETFLPEDNDIHFIAASDRHSLNAGVFLIRVDSWSLNMLMRAVSYQYYNPKERVGYSDQTSINHLLIDFKEDRHYVIVPQSWFNNYPDLKKPGNFIVHYAGRKNKMEVFEEDREEAYTEDKRWAKAKTNKQLRKEVLNYYRLTRDKQKKLTKED